MATDEARDFAGGVVVKIGENLFEDLWDMNWVDTRGTKSYF